MRKLLIGIVLSLFTLAALGAGVGVRTDQNGKDFASASATLANLGGAASFTNAITLYVDPSGSDTNDGRSVQRPKKTIIAAAAAITNGTIYVNPGTYNEVNTVLLNGGTSLVGQSAQTTIINFTNTSLSADTTTALTVMSNTTVQGVTINLNITNAYAWIGIGDTALNQGEGGNSNLVFRACYLNGVSDVFWINDFVWGVQMLVDNCRITSMWDTFANAGDFGVTTNYSIQIFNTDFTYDGRTHPTINSHTAYEPSIFNFTPYLGEIEMKNCRGYWFGGTNGAFANQNPGSPAGISLKLKDVACYYYPSNTAGVFMITPDVFAAAFTNKTIANLTWTSNSVQNALSGGAFKTDTLTVNTNATVAGTLTVSSNLTVTGSATVGSLTGSTNVTTPAVKTPLVKPQDASGSNIDGTNQVVAAGVSTGTGRAGAYVEQTGLTGTTGSTTNALTTRRFVSAKPVTLTSSGTATLVCNIPLATGKVFGGHIEYILTSTDGTDFQVWTGSGYVSGANKAGTVTPNAANSTGNGNCVTGGTITSGTLTAVANGASVDVKLAVTSSLTSPTLTAIWQIVLSSNDAITVTPQ